MKRFTFSFSVILVCVFLTHAIFALKLKKEIWGGLNAKSIVHSGTGLFFAQNMMYRHTITVYDRTFRLVKTIHDKVKLSDYGFKYKGTHKGSPVEAAFSHNGKYAWVSNYVMYGSGFHNHGGDSCTPKGKHDKSFLYKINSQSLQIEDVIKVGAVPKFVATTPNDKYVLVTNWCTWDLSIVDPVAGKQIKTVYLGRYPRGIEVTADSKIAYVAVMGSHNIAVVDLDTFQVSWIKKVGASPRHLNLDRERNILYATLNGEGRVAKIDLATHKVLKKVVTGKAPRSMILSDDGKYLYVVNYHSDTVSKVRTSDMKVLTSAKTAKRPIGIAYDPLMKQIWVSCYSGTLMIFQD